MSTNALVVFFLVAFQSSVWASLNLHGQPLFSGVTEFTFEVATATLTKATPCYITSGNVSQCRKKRGMEEEPEIRSDGLEIAPSSVMGVEVTPAPRALNFNSNAFRNYKIASSFEDSYFNNMNLFRQLANKGRNNYVTVGDCGMSTVNFSQFLSCLGMTVQETTTLTATFTETSTLSTGYSTMTVMGCTPAGFSYINCLSTPFVSNSQTTETRPKFGARTPGVRRPL